MMTKFTELGLFRVEHDMYGIGIDHIQEIDRTQDFTPVFNTSTDIKGIINLRGQIVTILNLRTRFGYDDRPLDPNNRTIIVNHGDEVVGLLVDSMEDIIKVDASSFDQGRSAGKENVDNEYFSGIYKTDSDLIIVVDLEKVLATNRELLNG